MAHVEDLWTKTAPNGARNHTTRWGTGRRWRARWTTPDGTRRSATFATQTEAKQHLATTNTPPDTLDTPPLQIPWHTRPLQNGGIPGFSATGYVLAYMRACDPINPLDTLEGDTVRRTTRNQQREHRAHIYAKATLDLIRQPA